jgi:hypothetical protein
MGTLHPHGWWVQGGYKLAGLGLELPLVNNVELVGRYDASRDGFFAKSDRFTVGYIYYLTNTLLFEGDYNFTESTDPGADHNSFVFQISYGF